MTRPFRITSPPIDEPAESGPLGIIIQGRPATPVRARLRAYLWTGAPAADPEPADEAPGVAALALS